VKHVWSYPNSGNVAANALRKDPYLVTMDAPYESIFVQTQLALECDLGAY